MDSNKISNAHVQCNIYEFNALLLHYNVLYFRFKLLLAAIQQHNFQWLADEGKKSAEKSKQKFKAVHGKSKRVFKLWYKHLACAYHSTNIIYVCSFFSNFYYIGNHRKR